MTFRPLLPLPSLLLLASVLGCSSHDAGSGAVVPSFHDVTEAPAAIQSAARAVVRIATAGSYATGSFISGDGQLLTNNHVLGVEVCPREGCYATITRMHQRGAAPLDDETIFVVPQAIDIGLDVAILQAYSADPASGGTKLVTPDALSFDPRSPADLEGVHVNIVGHPEGDLKKWTAGEVIDSSGSWIWSTAFTLPGNSGSPILGDDGRIVGILHRGPATQDLLTANGADTYSIGTASAPLVAAMGGALPAALISIAADTTADDLVAHELVFRNARVATASVAGVTTSVLDGLAVACDAGLARQDLASPDDADDAFAPCYAAEAWIECRADAATAGSFGVCPGSDAITAWQGRFRSLVDRWRTLNGSLDLSPATFGLARLQPTKAEGLTAAQAELSSILSSAAPPLDFNLATYLAAFDVTSYAGAALLDYVTQYGKQAGYELSASAIANAALWLNYDQALDYAGVQTLLNALAADPKVAMGAKLYVEEIEYNSNMIQ